MLCAGTIATVCVSTVVVSSYLLVVLTGFLPVWDQSYEKPVADRLQLCVQPYATSPQQFGCDCVNSGVFKDQSRCSCTQNGSKDLRPDQTLKHYLLVSHEKHNGESKP